MKVWECFPCSLNRFEYTSLIRPIHLERSNVQVLYRLNIQTMFNCPVVQIYAFMLQTLCLVVVLTRMSLNTRYRCSKTLNSRHKVQTNRVSVALWRSLKWLLFTRKTFPRFIQWKWSLVQVRTLKMCDVNRNSDCDLRSSVALLSDRL